MAKDRSNHEIIHISDLSCVVNVTHVLGLLVNVIANVHLVRTVDLASDSDVVRERYAALIIVLVEQDLSLTVVGVKIFVSVVSKELVLLSF